MTTQSDTENHAKKIAAGKLLSKFIREIAEEIHDDPIIKARGEDAVMLTKAEALARYMWKAAEKGNVTMMIWLSKNLLGMHEPIIIEPVREEAKGVFNGWYETTTKG